MGQVCELRAVGGQVHVVQRDARRSRIEAIKAAVTEGRLGRTIIGSQIINGRRVMVQKRHAFAISVGEQPVKKR